MLAALRHQPADQAPDAGLLTPVKHGIDEILLIDTAGPQIEHAGPDGDYQAIDHLVGHRGLQVRRGTEMMGDVAVRHAQPGGDAAR